MPQQTLGELFTSVVGGLPGTEDLNAKASTANPVFTGSISLGRKANTTVGEKSFAVGNNITASGQNSHAEGSNTIANSLSTHAEGSSTTASGSYAHAEGAYTYATDSSAHAEGYSTRAGRYSHSENAYTIANGYSTHASGVYNNRMTIFSNWTANTSYAVGDECSYSNAYYKCIQANSDSEFDVSKWERSNFINSKEAFVVGNGISDDDRSNALTLDWSGDLHLAKDVYVNANADGTSGSKVATEAYVTTRIPAPPSSDGTYLLQLVVSSGTPTYSWVAAPSASGVSY